MSRQGSDRMSTEITTAIDALFRDFDRPDVPGCALGIFQTGECLYSRGYGIANLEYDLPITPGTVFAIASMSKQFTAACIALMEEQGQVYLNADIRTWLPELPDYKRPLTVANLVYMTNGLYDFYDLANFVAGVRENDFITREQAWEYIRACDWLMFEPGSQFGYGNTGYFLLAELVERISGKSLSQFAHENIFEPLGMHNTLFRDDRTKIIKNRAESYSSYEHVHYNTRRPPFVTQGDKYLVNADLFELPGAGQVWSSVEDLFRWDCNHYHNRLGKGDPGLIAKLITPGILNDGQSTGYAYGLFCGRKDGLDYVSHGGWANGYSCLMHRVPQRQLTVICLANHTDTFHQLEVYPGSYSLPEQVMELVLKDFSVQRTPQPATDRTKDPVPEDWGPLPGRYQDPEDSWLLTVDVRDGKCTADLGYGRVLELVRIDDVNFKTADGNVTLTLVAGEQGLRLLMQDGDKSRVFHPFIPPLSVDALLEFQGEYQCEAISTSYMVTVEDGKLLMLNKDRRHTAVDFLWSPSIRDTFLAEHPPYCPFYCITFNRNAAGVVVSMMFRDDEGSGRERLVFNKADAASG